MIITIMTEYVPVNDTESIFNSTNNNLSVLVKRQSTILIPIRNVSEPIASPVQVLISHHPDFNVTRLKLFTTADSVLTYKGDFISNENNSKSKTQGVWDMNVYARHNLELGNTSNAYIIDVFYFNYTNTNITNSIIRFPIVFTWPIQTMDFSLLSYFWIVLVGVIISRISKRYIDQDQQKNIKSLDEAARNLGPVDYFSIG
jgi:hypothetical protein